MSDQVSPECPDMMSYSFLSTSRTIHLYKNLSRQLIYHSRFAGRHETAIPPGVRREREVKHIGGLALVDPKSSIENFSDKVLHPAACQRKKITYYYEQLLSKQDAAAT